MNIKSVRYERLFNIGEFQHETIGFIADIDEKENHIQALGKLYDMVTKANKKINKLRKIAEKLYSLERTDGYYCSSIYYSEHEIESTEHDLKELMDSEEKDEFNIERLKKNLKKYTDELEKKIALQEKLTKEYQIMINNFKKGIL